MTKLTGPRPNSTLYCSFCGKSQHEIKKLVAGPTVFICEGCTGLAVRIQAGFGLGGEVLMSMFNNGDEHHLRIRNILYPSVGVLLREGGLQKRKGPYTVQEVFSAMANVLSATFEEEPSPLSEKAREAERLRGEIERHERMSRNELYKVVGPLKDKLRALEADDSA